MENATTIQLKEDFFRWFNAIRTEGDLHQDVVHKILLKQSPEKIEEMLRMHAYDYHAFVGRLGIRLKNQ